MPHSLQYSIVGDHIPIVEITLHPGQTVIAEAGAMNYLEPGIGFKASLGDGSNMNQGLTKRVLSASKRALGGEALFMTHFTNHVNVERKVAFAAPYPGSILAIDLSEYNNELLCQPDSFLCGSTDISIESAINKQLSVGLFGGEGFILQHLKGSGLVFIHAGGTLIKKELTDDAIYIDTGCLVAFTQQLDHTIEKAGNFKTRLLGGEGRYLAKLAGTGTVYLQSMPFSRMADKIASGGGERTFFGRFGRWLGGS